MAGGTWTSQNKVRPGVYINFKAVTKSSMTTGDRGIVAIPLNLSWGAEGSLIEVLSTDLSNGNSLKSVGFVATDSASKLLRGALSYCYKALVYRTTTGGDKASWTTDEGFTITAKYAGTFGNNISIEIVEDDAINKIYTVNTYVNGDVVDKQTVNDSDVSKGGLEDNDWVTFGTTGTLATHASTKLTDGTDGTEATDVYTKYMKCLESSKFQTACCLSSETTIKSAFATWVKNQRDSEGRYIQGVLANYDADYEGIVNSVSSVVIDGETFSATDFVAVVGGMTAGANFNQSNTAKKIIGATSVVNELSNSDIIKALNAGKIVATTSASGVIKIEKDINSLHTFTKERNYSYSKNRVIRVLDEIGTTTKSTWEDTYMGKFDNNDVGRSLFRGDLIEYSMKLETLNAIQDFSSDDIEVIQGNDVDSVVVNWGVTPVDSMEKLYMTVNTNS